MFKFRTCFQIMQFEHLCKSIGCEYNIVEILPDKWCYATVKVTEHEKAKFSAYNIG